MKSEILNFLVPVRGRLRLQSALSLLSAGATLGSVICLLLGIARVTTGWEPGLAQFATVFLGTTVGFGLVGYVLNRSWLESAAAIDSHYQLKDRTVSALEFCEQPASALQQLQIEDATSHLTSVDAKAVVQFKAPRQLAWACLSIAAASLMMFAPLASTVQAEVNQPNGISEAAEEIAAEVEQLEELAEESGLEELKELVVLLKEDLEELEDPETDVRESLETISEMQQKMQALMAQMNIAGMDAEISAMAEAMAGAEAFKAASDALKKDELDKAAEALENVNPENMDRTESRPTSEKLALSAASAKKKGFGKLSETLAKLSESVKKSDSESTCENCNSLSKEIKKMALCKSMSKMLNSKCDKLGECKKLCSGNCNKAGNGSCPGTGINMAQGKSNQKSNSSSKKAGATSAGNIDGQKTRLDGQRQMATLTGELGAEGDSEFETETSPEAQEQATRRARDAFSKYQKMSEAVLESEPIPLGHRQTIRNYFELIRPSAEDEKAAETEAAGVVSE